MSSHSSFSDSEPHPTGLPPGETSIAAELDPYQNQVLKLLGRITMDGAEIIHHLENITQQLGELTNAVGATSETLTASLIQQKAVFGRMQASLDRLVPPIGPPKAFLEPKDETLVPTPTSYADQVRKVHDRLTSVPVPPNTVPKTPEEQLNETKELVSEVLKWSIYNGQAANPAYTKNSLSINDQQFFVILKELARRGYIENPTSPRTRKPLAESDFEDRFTVPGFAVGIKVKSNNTNSSTTRVRLAELMKPYIDRVRELNLSNEFLREYPFSHTEPPHTFTPTPNPK